MNIEKTISELNKPVDWGVGPLSAVTRPIPENAVREALVYALDSNKYHHMVELTWKDRTLDIYFVRDDGWKRDLMDHFRALGLSDPRMQGQPGYPVDARSMIVVGLDGPGYADGRVHIVGGEPDLNVVRFMRDIRPTRILDNE
ncbi:MAG: hypothetical protein MR654_05385 [Corynebacterium glucuronolyticum]|nr:hypothetical protein [Corynebacterium glucuronolyticum]